MNLLFPCDPLNPERVDPDFAEQAWEARDEGFSTFLVSFEDLVAGAARPWTGKAERAVRRVPEGPCLYRGWMMKPAVYEAFCQALAARGAAMIVQPAAYLYAHHLPSWYADFREVTAPTVWSSDPSDAGVLLDQLAACLPDAATDCPVAAIVKDFVKSAKHRWHEACFIPDIRDRGRAMRVVDAFLAERAMTSTAGLCCGRSGPTPRRASVVGLALIARRARAGR